MKLHLLENIIETFLVRETKSQSIDWHFPHSLVSHFHQHWKTPDPSTLKATYEQCLRSEISQRWWKGDRYRPKELMLLLIDTDPELAAIAWKDLANEAGTLDGRLDRFGFYCDDLLQMYRKKNPRDVVNHHHQDTSIISLYLAGMYPDKYVLYPGLTSFQHFLKAVESPQIPVVDDYVRYMKVATIIFMYLKRNALFDQLLQHRNGPHLKITSLPLQIAYEVVDKVTNHPNL